MKIIDLIAQLEKQQNDEYKDDITTFLGELKKSDPNTIVQISNGDCEDDGVYAPSKDGKIYRELAQPFREGEGFPDDGRDWVRIAYLPRLHKSL